MIIRYLAFLLAIGVLGCRSAAREVDLIVYNAKVYTVDSLFSIKEAFAIKDGKFVAVGNSDEIKSKYVSKNKINADGKTVYPGFYDAHAHFFSYAESLNEVDLVGASSIEEVINKIKAFAEKHPEKDWLIGRGWNQNLWLSKAFPTKDVLDKNFPGKAIFLSRIDGHAAWVNSKALDLNNIYETKRVLGGLISGKNNTPDGILVDNAMDLISIPEISETEYLSLLKQAQDSLFAVGLTSIADAGLSVKNIDYLKKFYKNNDLKIRDYVMIGGTKANVAKYLKEGFYESDKLDIKSFKIVGDGALGSRGACLLEHYRDAPTNGFLLYSPEELEEIIKTLAESKFQVNTHAIGDSANRIVLDLYGKYLKNNLERRWRIEHAQVITPIDFAKFKQFQIIPSVQPTHATSDMYWAKDRLGEERMPGAYAYKQLLQQYGKLALGSDFPVEHINPMYGFHAAVARVDAKGFPAGGFQMQDVLTREEALKGMTIWAAYSCFQENKRGSIEKNKDADFVIMDADIMTVDLTKLRNIKSIRTVVGGETVFVR